MAAGNSQFALQNIAAGGMQGIKSLAAAKERASAAEEKRFAIEADLAKAQRAEQVAATTYGADSKQAAEKNALTVGLSSQEAAARVKEVNAKGKYEAQALNAQLAMEDKKIAASVANVTRQINAEDNRAIRDEKKSDLAGIVAQLDSVTDGLTELHKDLRAVIAVDPSNPQIMDIKADITKAQDSRAILFGQIQSLSTGGTKNSKQPLSAYDKQ